ncbi:DUF4097 family beta strand repeat-containing protein [Sporosarcina sp. Te-1]|uniref:DUF4097 family beta strand repeat-containing protein n=1 Tax=Sporosarcina sp. Te-1 TaxID=2818390 RepID=UPI001A9F3C46|nr:DUF4097 family beta strand repeat-containing protein [Sporosarcina sp. Te-1]QTD42729.1 DUF4097 family beta strand repeat protein [Sporosarcina sp. Te-1]
MLKKLVIVVLLLGIGIGLFVFFKQPNKTMTIGTYEAVPAIEADLQMMTIEMSSSPDDKIHVRLEGKKGSEEKISIDHDATKLVIKEQNENVKWNNFIQVGSQPKIIIQTPKSLANTITISNRDGDTNLKGLAAETIEVKSTTGRVTLQDMTVSKSELQSTDGSITIHKSAIENGNIASTTGNVTVRESTGAALAIQSTDGQIKMMEATEQSDVRLKSKTGDIQVSYKTAPSSLQLSTSGEIVKIDLSNFDQQTRQIGDGANQLSIETKDGVINVK